MNISAVLVIVMAVLAAAGVYAMLERSLTRVLLGFLLLGNAINLLLLIVMGVPGSPPFFSSSDPASPDEVSDPLPQALTLTAIVITFAMTAFLLALIYRTWLLGQQDDSVHVDEEDVKVRERTEEEDQVIDDDADISADTAATDFVGLDTTPIVVLHTADVTALDDAAGVDRPADSDHRNPPAGPEGGER